MMKQLSICAVILMVMISAGCKEKDKYTLKFSHVLHVKDNEIACADCHGEIKDGRLARPTHDACNSCHDDMMKTNNISVKTCGMCHKQKNLNEIPKAAKPVAKAVSVFVHTPALKKECANCHDRTVAVKSDYVDRLSSGDKIAIRQKAHEGGKSCDTCHVGMSPLTPPANHKKDWVRRHGPISDEPDKVCGICHSEDTCRACHQVNKPSSHNNLWRMKTHGIAASWERSKCQVCHEEDTCVACHSEMKPRSHNASWKKRHCGQCHGSQDRGTGCETCHKNGLETHPNPHDAGWRTRHCDTCHNGSPEGNQCSLCHENAIEKHPNPHGGNWLSQHCNSCHNESDDKCRICHSTRLDSHPNPHPAGWRSSHCNSCHAGTPETEKCSMCHQGGIAGHPNPHPAGWKTSHCNSCHADTSQDQCQICHVGVSGHPNPHAAGWRIQHCSQCHFGTPQAQTCLTCHPPGHTTPHDAMWLGNHCDSCHVTGSAECEQCHIGGSTVTIHESRWPGEHTATGYTEADCFNAGCHGGNKKSLRLRKGRGLRLPSSLQRLPAKPRK